jgi:Zn-dependent protease with chaperone function
VDASELPSLLGLALVGAGVCFLLARRWGAPLIEAIDAPDFVERYQRHRGRMAGAILLTILLQPLALPILAGPEVLSLDLALPLVLGLGSLTWIGAAAGDFPARQKIFRENWSFGAYLLYWIRLATGLLGFWLLLIGSPWLVRAWPGSDWIGAGLTLALLLGLAALHLRMLSTVLQMRPLESGSLRERLEAVAAQARCAAPEILVFGPDGSSWCNAFAMPHVRRPRVLFTRALLGRLDAAAASAVFAHELAHLEEFDRPRLRALQALVGGLCVVGSFGAPLLGLLGPGLAEWFPLPWIVLLLALSLLRLSYSRGHEAASDLRAIELCGDGAALIRGLTELHVANALPRRWRADVERMSTHPSLARRIQAIREAAGLPEDEAETQPLLLRSRKQSGQAALLDAEGTHWLEGLPPDAAPDEACEAAEKRHSLVYEELVELQLEHRRGGAQLRAQTRAGETHELALVPDDLALLQARLDHIDGRLAPLGAAAAHPGWAVLAGFTAGIGGFFLVMAHATWPFWPVLTLSLTIVVMLRRRRAALAGLGAMSLVAGAHVGTSLNDAPGLAWLGVSALLLGGLWCVALAFPRGPAEQSPHSPRATTAVLICLALPGLLGLWIASSSGSGTQLYAFAHTSGFSLLPLIGAAGALLTSRRRFSRWTAYPLIGLASVPLLLGHPAGVDRWIEDPFVVPAAQVEHRDQAAHVLRERTLDLPLWSLKTSPAGSWIAGSDPQGGYTLVRMSDGLRHEVQAADLAFVDEERFLTLRWQEDIPRLVLAGVAAPDEVLWSLPLPPQADDEWLTLRAHGPQWQILRAGPTMATLRSGHVGAPETDTRSWSIAGEAHLAAASGPRALELHYSGQDRGAPWSRERLAHVLGARPRLVDVRWNGDATGRTSALAVGCHAPTHLVRDVLCVASLGEHAWTWLGDTKTGQLAPAARTRQGWSQVWTGHELAQLSRHALLLDDPRSASGRRLRLPRPAHEWSMLAAGDAVWAISWPRGEATHVAILTPE